MHCMFTQDTDNVYRLLISTLGLVLLYRLYGVVHQLMTVHALRLSSYLALSKLPLQSCYEGLLIDTAFRSRASRRHLLKITPD